MSQQQQNNSDNPLTSRRTNGVKKSLRIYKQTDTLRKGRRCKPSGNTKKFSANNKINRSHRRAHRGAESWHLWLQLFYVKPRGLQIQLLAKLCSTKFSIQRFVTITNNCIRFAIFWNEGRICSRITLWYILYACAFVRPNWHFSRLKKNEKCADKIADDNS